MEALINGSLPLEIKEVGCAFLVLLKELLDDTCNLEN
jgi:hypothetical protein